MKPGIPWSVKGIDSEAREAAKHAARRSGMTLGEWLNGVILDSSVEEGAEEEQRGQVRGDLSTQLGGLARQLARLSETQASRQAAFDTDQGSAGALLTRIEGGERQTAEALLNLNEQLGALGRQISEAPAPPNIEDSPGYQALESALRNIIDHIEVSDKRTRDAIKSMQERLSEMAQRAAAAESEAVVQNAPAIGRLESRLAGMAERLERTEAAAQHGIPVIVQTELARLAERIETVKTSSELAAQRAQSVAQATAQRELREIEGRIHALVQEAQSTMRGASGAGAELKGLRGEVEGLAQRFDDLKADAASERDVHALRLAVEQLSARIAQAPDLRPVAEMDRKLAELTRRVEQGQGDPRLATQLSDLDSRVYELDRRLVDMLQRSDDTRSRHALEAQIAAVADRIAGAEQQLGHLATLDRSVNQLQASLEQGRSWAKTMAEDAANRMAERLKQAQPKPFLSSDGRSEDLRALERGLEAVKASAATTDRRNQETLEAVHETLEQIVNRLAEMEAQPAPPAFKLPPTSAKPAAAADIRWQAPSRPPSAADLPQPVPRLAPFPAMAGEPSLAPQPVTPDFTAMPDAVEPQFPRDDFIAAARRAAQAAAQRQIGPAAGGLGLMGRANQKTSSFRLLPRLSLPFAGRRSQQDNPPPSPGGLHYAVKDESGKRRTLILAGLVLLAAASAYTFTNVYSRPAPEPAPPALQEPAPVPHSSGAPAEPPPAEKDSGMPAPETLMPDPETRKTSAIVVDGILTGALPAAKQDATLASIVAEPGAAAAPMDMPPPGTGPDSLRQAAKDGNPVAQFLVASRYLDGKQVEQDLTQAARWYQAAAEAGLAPAQYRIATLFERGRGVPLDLSAARLWYERAGERGNIKAMHNAAVIYAGNQAGAPDYPKAVKWFTTAAQHGLKDSQYNLAVLYERGMGIEQDGGRALFWYSLAGRQDDADAARRADALARTLPAAQVKQIQARLAAWRAQPASPEANVVALADPQWRTPGDGDAESAAAPAPETNSVIFRAQELLNDLGFKVGGPDGKMGARTANAIRLFELQSGLKVTGQATPELISKLEAKKVIPAVSKID